MKKEINPGKFAAAAVIFGIISGITTLVKGVCKKQHEKKYGWLSEWKADLENLPEGSNIFLDTDRQKLIDYDTGEILEDFSRHEDPKKAMTEFTNLMWSFK